MNGEINMELLTIGEKIRRLRKEKNMYLRELGGDFVSKAQLSYIENGKASPKLVKKTIMNVRSILILMI
jgi:transcriptional regulator with XRE-family HTH domain